MSISLNYGDAYIIHSRNSCVAAFLESDMDWLFFADDDVIFPCGNAGWFNTVTDFNLPEKYAGLHTIDRLLSHGKSFVGGLYFGRNKYGLAMYSEGACNPKEAEFARKGPQDIVKPTRWIATGALLISRQVFLDIERKFPFLGRKKGEKRVHFFSPTEHNLLETVNRTKMLLEEGPMTGEKALKAYEMLEQGVNEARRESSLGAGEDVTLCRRAAACGHIPHVDLGLICGHVSAGTVYGPRNTFPKLQ